MTGTQWLALFAAGGTGACLRVLLAGAVEAALVRPGGSPLHAGTLAVNLLGCLAMGVCAGALAPGPWRVVLGAGLLGGFTTYSAYALLTVELAQEGRWAAVGGQVGLHLVGGVLALAAGLWFGRLLQPG